MLKFLRKYQKWMLAVFCVALMVAFLVPQAAQQFIPNPATATMGTTFDGQEIKRDELVSVINDLSLLRRMRVEPLPFLSLIPSTGQDLDDAMQWELIQRAADYNNLQAGDAEAFELVASLLGAETQDELNEKAKELNANGPYLMKLGKQYLKAEQLRQLLLGVEYTQPEGETSMSGSPGLRRVRALNEALSSIQQAAMQFQQMGLPPQQAEQIAINSVLGSEGFLDKINGHFRVSADELRYTMQREYAEVDLTVVVLDVEGRVESTSVDDQAVEELFERYAEDAPGTGEPYGLGYRVPARVKIEALRVPIDAAREAVAQAITPEDVRKFYDENRASFMDFEDPEQLGSERLTPAQRDEIRLILTQVRADRKVQEIAQQVRARLNEDARGLDDQGNYKVLPEDFTPTAMLQVASEVEQEHGIALEFITVEDWVSSQDVLESAQFTQEWANELPKSSVRLPNPRAGNMLMAQDVYQSTLGGKAGLFATLVPEINDGQRPLLFGELIGFAKPFVDEESPQASLGLQVGLPGRILRDLTRSAYVFRLTDAMPDHPAEDLAPIYQTVREDAKQVKAYESLVAESDQLLAKAAEQSIESLMKSADAKQTLTGLNRAELRQGAPPVQGLTSSTPIIQQAFAKVDDMLLAGDIAEAAESQRLFAVELAGDYKLAIVRIDSYRPLTLKDYQDLASEPNALMLASRFEPPEDIEPAMSMDALMRYTKFKWAEGFGPETLSGGDDEALDGEEE